MVVPLLPTDLDPTVVTALLARRHPGVEVVRVDVREVHEVTNTHVRVAVEYATPGELPPTMFVKMVPRDPARRVQIAQTDMGRREVRFYDELAPHLGFRVPEVYGTAFDPDDGAFVLCMEDLTATGCTVSDGTVGVSADGRRSGPRASSPRCTPATRIRPGGRPRFRGSPTPTRGSPYAVTMLAEALADAPRPPLARLLCDRGGLRGRQRRAPGRLARRSRHRHPRRSPSRQPVRRPRPGRLPRLGDRPRRFGDARRRATS